MNGSHTNRKFDKRDDGGYWSKLKSCKGKARKAFLSSRMVCSDCGCEKHGNTPEGNPCGCLNEPGLFGKHISRAT